VSRDGRRVLDERRGDAVLFVVLGLTFLAIGVFTVGALASIWAANDGDPAALVEVETSRRVTGSLLSVILGYGFVAAFFLGLSAYGTVSGVRRLIRRR
jgi:hypothetical protein